MKIFKLFDKKSLKDSFFNSVDYSLSVLIFIFISKYIIARIGNDGYGFYIFFSSLIATFGVADLGFGSAVSKYISEFVHKNDFESVNMVFTLALNFYSKVVSVLLLILIILNHYIYEIVEINSKYTNITTQSLFIIFFAFVANIYCSIFTNILISHSSWFLISIINSSVKFLNLVFVILIFIFYESKVDLILILFYVILCCSIIKLLITIVCAVKVYPKIKIKKSNILIKNKIYRFIKISSIQYIFSLIGGHLDKFIIAKLFGLSVLANYTFIYRAANFLIGFVANIFKIYIPKLSILHSSNNFSSLRKYFKYLILLSFSISLIFSLLLYLLWEDIITFIYNEQFAFNTSSYLLFFCVYIVIRSPESIIFYFSNAVAKPEILVYCVSVGIPLTIAFYFIMIPIFNDKGLIISQIVSSLLTISSIVFYVKYLIKNKKLYTT